MKPSLALRAFLVLTGSVFLAAQIAQATPYTWISTTGGARSWTDTANWAGGTQYVSGSGNELIFFADTTTNIPAITQTFTNVPATLAMNTLTLNGKGAFSGASSSSITIGSGASTWTIGDGTTSSVNLNATFGSTSAANFNYNVAANVTLNQATTLFTGNGTAGVHNNVGNGFLFSGNIGDGVNDYGITKSGTSRLTLSGANTYSGTTTLNDGILQIGSNSVGTVGSITSSAIGTGGLTLGGGTLSSNGATARTILNEVTFTGNVALGHAGSTGKLTFSATSELGSATRTLTTNSEVEFAGSISSTGAFGITKAGAGTLILSNSNSYTGVTTVNAGVLLLNHNTALSGGIGTTGGTSALTFNGGVLGLGAGNFTRNLGSAGTSTDVNFTGAGGWAAFGADRLVNLGGASAQVPWATANTGFNAQTLILSHATATHKVTLQNGLDLGTAIRTVQTDNGTASVDGELSGVITGGAGGGLTKTGAGTLSLSNANTYTGRTTVNAGVLLLEHATALPGGIGATGGTSNLTFTGGVLGLANGNFARPLGSNATADAVNFTNAGGWAAFGADRTVNLGGASASITWATANTGFNNQTLILGHATATHMVDLQNPLVVTTARTVQVDNGSASIDAKLSGAISGTSGNINKTGTGTLWISGNMSNTGGLTISGGTVTLSGTNTYSGNTNFSAAGTTLILAGTQSVSPNTTFVMNTNASTSDSTAKLLDDTGGVNGSTVSVPNTFTIQNNNSPGNAHTFIVGNNNTANGGTSSGTTTGSTIAFGALNWNTYAAGTTAYGPINIQGTDQYRLQMNSVVLHNAANLTSLTVGQTTFNPTTANVTIGTVTVGTGNTGQGYQTFVMDGTSSDNRVTGAISNASDFGISNRELRVTKSNTSTWTLNGTGSSYTGATAVNGGTLVGIGANAFGSTSGISIAAANTATLSLRGDTSTNFVKASDSSLYSVTTTANGATINVDRATVAGTAAKTMTIGTLALNNAVTNGTTFSGANNTSLSIGAVTTSAAASGTETLTNNISGGGSLTLASIAVNRTGTPTLAFAGNGDTTITGNLTQVATTILTKGGNGKLTIEGTSSLSGATNVNAGSLIINGSTSTGTVTVASVATIGGIGTVGGNTTLNGTLSPGQSPGELTFAGNLTVNNGSTYLFEAGDLTIVDATLDLNDNWTLALGIGFQDGGSVTIFDYGTIASSPDLIPTFDITSLGFSPSGGLTLTDTGSSIVLNGVSVIPEPGAVLLGSLGFLLLFRRRR